MWTIKNRKRYDRSHLRHPSDLSDEEWQHIAPLIRPVYAQILAAVNIALKGNQTSLREDVDVFVAEQKVNGFEDTKISRHETVAGDHGRIESGTYEGAP
jgi:hypothetical protein